MADDTGCGWLVRSQPAVDVVGGHFRIVARGEAQVGTRLGGEQSLTVLAWNGFVDAFLVPGLDVAAHAVTFTVVDSNVYEADHGKGRPTGRLWHLVKDHVYLRLGTLRIDVSRPFGDSACGCRSSCRAARSARMTGRVSSYIA